MHIPVILADYPTGSLTSMIILFLSGAIMMVCLLIAGVLHTTGNNEDRNRFLRAAKISVLVGFALAVVLSFVARGLDLP